MPRIVIVTTGGTIASRVDPDTGATVAAVDAEDLLASVPQLADLADIDSHEFALVNSWDMTPSMMASLARDLVRIAGEGRPDGIVVTHGTDTMEETAFALDLVLDLDVPVVVTGAMRSADSPGTDGPRNLLAAVRAVTSGALEAVGVTVVMNEEIHAARHVTKLHTTALDTFGSPDTGPLGTVDDHGVLIRWRPPRRPGLELVDPEPAVSLVKMVAGLDDQPLRHLAEDGVRGVVLEGSGSGNVNSACQPAIRQLLGDGIPVVLASRCLAGRVVPSYGGDGGGATLVDLGVVTAGDLGGLKARLALMFLLGAGADIEATRTWFAGLH